METKKIIIRLGILVAILALLGAIFPQWEEWLFRLMFGILGYAGATIEHIHKANQT